jgi:hypothetical protein
VSNASTRGGKRVQASRAASCISITSSARLIEAASQEAIRRARAETDKIDEREQQIQQEEVRNETEIREKEAIERIRRDAQVAQEVAKKALRDAHEEAEKIARDAQEAARRVREESQREIREAENQAKKAKRRRDASKERFETGARLAEDLASINEGEVGESIRGMDIQGINDWVKKSTQNCTTERIPETIETITEQRTGDVVGEKRTNEKKGDKSPTKIPGPSKQKSPTKRKAGTQKQRPEETEHQEVHGLWNQPAADKTPGQTQSQLLKKQVETQNQLIEQLLTKGNQTAETVFTRKGRSEGARDHTGGRGVGLGGEFPIAGNPLVRPGDAPDLANSVRHDNGINEIT